MSEASSLLSNTFAQRSGSTALICGEIRLSYAQLYRRAASLVERLRLDGINRRMTVAVELSNSIDFAVVYIAGAVGGYRIVPVNPALPESQKQYLYANTPPDKIIRKGLHLDDTAILKVHDSGYHFDPDAELIFFTSGTTSQPKGVRHSFARMVENVSAFNRLAGIDETTVMINVMPMSYMAGFLNTLLSPLLAGGTVIITPGFSADMARNFWPLAIQHDINTLWLSPTMAAMLARLNRSEEITAWTTKNLHQIFVGTAPLPQTVRNAFETVFGVICRESYGMTEVLLVSCQVEEDGFCDGSVGRVLDGVEIQTRNAAGHDLTPGEEGELWLRSPYMLIEYRIGECGEPQQPFLDEWLPTGDLGRIDSQGRLYITGRLKDLIIHGGINVSPRAVEDVLISHPEVSEAAVLGKAHPFWGEEVIAFIALKNESPSKLEDLKSYCQARLVPDAVPSRFEVLSKLPMTVTGKIRKELLRKHL
ncbi:MAG: acyl--CoA ligase [Proteobacteria bacterium]|nr:acyl--CoA ligase [Pseudomonadota bacterium]MBU1709851.1 acyl--CoA ligase [Pseudomonadota bacterium]